MKRKFTNKMIRLADGRIAQVTRDGDNLTVRAHGETITVLDGVVKVEATA